MKNLVAILLGAGAAGLYLGSAQRAFYDDGIRFLGMLEAGELAYIHVLYLPVVAALRDLLSGFGVEYEQALKITAALSGGMAVAVTARIGFDTMLRPSKAVAVALMLCGLFGFWYHSTATELHAFHAAFASLLLLGLIRLVDAPLRATPALWCLLFLAALTTPASHVSGIATGMPILAAWWFARGARWRMSLSIGLGLAAWAGVYLYLYHSDWMFRDYSGAQSGKLPRLLADPGLLPGQLQAVGAELLLYSVPAATLVPAGFRVLRQRAPKQAWVCLWWVLGWAILALPVGDRAYGSNFVATMPAQALLAVVALHALATSVPRMLLSTILAFAPLPVFWLAGELAALWTCGLAAALLCLLAGRVVAQPRWLFLPHLLLFGVSGSLMLPLIQRDPIRDYIAQVSVAVGPEAMVVYLEKLPNTHSTWVRYFPGAQEPRARAFDPFFIQFMTPAEADATLADYRQRIRTQMAGKGRLFLVEESPQGLSLLRYPERLKRFFAELQRDFRFTPTAVPRLFELQPRPR